jgi:hypothetical protein
VPRTVDALAELNVEAVLKAINVTRSAARARVWTLVGEHAPDSGHDGDDPPIVDLDATLVGRAQRESRVAMRSQASTRR